MFLIQFIHCLFCTRIEFYGLLVQFYRLTLKTRNLSVFPSFFVFFEKFLRVPFWQQSPFSEKGLFLFFGCFGSLPGSPPPPSTGVRVLISNADLKQKNGAAALNPARNSIIIIVLLYNYIVIQLCNYIMSALSFSICSSLS
nr:MAG TPA: hypothetical protein [Caudoviricetes sp.]